MAETVENLTARLNALPYERTPEGRAAWREAQADLQRELATVLAAENGSFDLNPAQHQVIFEQAWADGHAEGYSGVQNAYIDLIDLADRLHAAR